MKIKRTLSVVFALTLPICAAACSGPQQQEESEVLPLWQQSEPYNGTHIYNIAETDEWLVRGGVCDYVIVLPAQAEEYEIFAASELADVFRRALQICPDIVEYDVRAPIRTQERWPWGR